MRKIKRIGSIIGTFFLWFFMAAVLLIPFTDATFECHLIDEESALVVAVVLSVLISAVFVYLIYMKGFLDSLWFSENCARLFIVYMIFVFFFISLSYETSFAYEDLREFVGIQWTIFTVSVAVFLVWNAFVMPSLEKKKPQKPDASSAIMRAIDIEKRQVHIARINSTFASITILIINLVTLFLATNAVYVNGTEKLLLLGQRLVIFSFYFCTNTLAMLLWDIARPLLDEKRKRLKEMTVTKEDITFVERVHNDLELLPLLIESIEKSTAILPEQKDEIKADLLKDLLHYKQENRSEEKNE